LTSTDTIMRPHSTSSYAAQKGVNPMSCSGCWLWRDLNPAVHVQRRFTQHGSRGVWVQRGRTMLCQVQQPLRVVPQAAKGADHQIGGHKDDQQNVCI
jgi:hypothetical protein